MHERKGGMKARAQLKAFAPGTLKEYFRRSKSVPSKISRGLKNIAPLQWIAFCQCRAWDARMGEKGGERERSTKVKEGGGKKSERGLSLQANGEILQRFIGWDAT